MPFPVDRVTELRLEGDRLIASGNAALADPRRHPEVERAPREVSRLHGKPVDDEVRAEIERLGAGGADLALVGRRIDAELKRLEPLVRTYRKGQDDLSALIVRSRYHAIDCAAGIMQSSRRDAPRSFDHDTWEEYAEEQARRLVELRKTLGAAPGGPCEPAERASSPPIDLGYVECIEILRALHRVPVRRETVVGQMIHEVWKMTYGRAEKVAPDTQTLHRDVKHAMLCRPKRGKATT